MLEMLFPKLQPIASITFGITEPAGLFDCVTRTGENKSQFLEEEEKR